MLEARQRKGEILLLPRRGVSGREIEIIVDVMQLDETADGKMALHEAPLQRRRLRLRPGAGMRGGDRQRGWLLRVSSGG